MKNSKGNTGMKKLLILTVLTCSLAYAAPFEYDYTIPCDDTITIMNSLRDNYKEELTWAGNHINDYSTYSLWVNDKEGTWTLLKMNPELSCILGVGETDKGSDRVSWKSLFMRN